MCAAVLHKYEVFHFCLVIYTDILTTFLMVVCINLRFISTPQIDKHHWNVIFQSMNFLGGMLKGHPV